MNIVNLPIMLTLSRLIISPLVLPILLVYLLPLNYLWVNIALALIFMGLSMTDFFDGYLARKYDQVTNLGKILDPLADKCLVYSALIALLAAGKLYFYWVIILIGREFFIMGLRLVAVEYSLSVPVSFMGKLKTAAQIGCIFFIIINPYQAQGFSNMAWNGTELALLIVAMGISLVSAHGYYKKFMIRFNTLEQ